MALTRLHASKIASKLVGGVYHKERSDLTVALLEPRSLPIEVPRRMTRCVMEHEYSPRNKINDARKVDD